MLREISILGSRIQLSKRGKGQLKGISVGDTLSYEFYDGEYRGLEMAFLVPQGRKPTPKDLALADARIGSVLNLPVVFILMPCPAYERQRLIDKNVFFVISDNFANLPMIVANERIRKSAYAKRLTPSAQYLLFYHLQVESLEGLSARDIADKMPYSYESVALALTCLSDLGLCRKVSGNGKNKNVVFDAKGRELWDVAQNYLINPVNSIVFCDELKAEDDYPVCGINALAHYSSLNKDDDRQIMVTANQYKALQRSDSMVHCNEFDGPIRIEVWKYPPVSKAAEPVSWADPLSVIVSLRDDHDPRVEGEVEYLIDRMIWKG